MKNNPADFRIFTREKKGKFKKALFRRVFNGVWLQLTPWVSDKETLIKLFDTFFDTVDDSDVGI